MGIANETNLLSSNNPETKTTIITRIMSAEYFISMLKTKRNTLALVSAWEDVYEGYVAKVKMVERTDHKTILSAEGLLKDVYGQCWSLRKEESELLWKARDYKNEKLGCEHDVVMIKTSLYKLVQSILNVEKHAGYAQSLARLAVVEYCLETEHISDDLAIDSSSHSAFIGSLFFKRKNFEDEKEVRLIIDGADNQIEKCLMVNLSKDRKLMSYEIKDVEFIEGVLYHPKMCQHRVTEIEEVIKTSDFSISQHQQSDLYNLPKIVINMFSKN